MFRTTCVLLALAVLPAIAPAQTDTTRRRDTTRTTQPQDTSRRVRSESRGQVDLTQSSERFRADLPNYGLSSDQATELQQALTRVGCNVGPADGVVGARTHQGIDCFRRQHDVAELDLESVLMALSMSFATPAPPPPEPVVAAPPKRDAPVLPPVFRQDSTYRPDVRARRDSALRRDSVRRDSLRRDSTARRDSTRPDTTRPPILPW